MITFSNPQAEAFANSICKTAINKRLKMVGPDNFKQILIPHPEPEYIEMLERQLQIYKEAAQAIQDSLNFIALCHSLGHVEPIESE